MRPPWAGRYRDLIPLCIHALLICHVITPLNRPAGRLAGPNADQRPPERPAAGPDGSADPRVARSGTDGGPEACAEEGSDDGAAYSSLR